VITVNGPAGFADMPAGYEGSQLACVVANEHAESHNSAEDSRHIELDYEIANI
jgi:hypothetical protein